MMLEGWAWLCMANRHRLSATTLCAPPSPTRPSVTPASSHLHFTMHLNTYVLNTYALNYEYNFIAASQLQLYDSTQVWDFHPQMTILGGMLQMCTPCSVCDPITGAGGGQ